MSIKLRKNIWYKTQNKDRRVMLISVDNGWYKHQIEYGGIFPEVHTYSMKIGNDIEFIQRYKIIGEK